MYHPASLFIGLRYLQGKSGDRFSRFVSYMSTAGITIGVMALVTVISVMNGFEDQLKSRILGVLPQAVISTPDQKVSLNDGIPSVIQDLSMSQDPKPITRSEAVIQSGQALSAGFLIGIEPSSSDPIVPHMMSGRLSALKPSQYQVILGHTLARNLNVRVGDKVRLMVTSASRFTPIGRIPSQRTFEVAGVFNTGSDVDAMLMVTHIDDASRLLRYPKNTVTGWRLFFDDPFVVSDYSSLTLPDNWIWSDWREQRGELFQAVKMEKNMMGLMLGLIVFVAAFNIISALIMVVMEKQSEVAILKTQGMTQQQILSIFVVQGASSGVIGALVGGALGTLLSVNLNQILALFNIALFGTGSQLPVVINSTQIITVIIAAIALSLLATLYPSYRASSAQPADALRYE
ncbi:lipoprotein-releasing ABC transporter permease subunit LolC [Vibrio sp.]|nr:lipoprotein-releasing ABC transporter permease subunit LolC [Vibrio sp.]